MGEAWSPGVLLGRNAEIETVSAAVRGLMAGQGGSVWLEGEPGIGKSAVAADVLARAADAGFVVLRGVGELLSQPRQLGALLACRRDPAPDRASSAETVGDLLGVGRTELLTVADTMAAMAYRLVELMESWCVRSPTVLLLDDVQWADEASLLVWGQFSEVARQAPLLLLAVSRPVPDRVEVSRLRDALVSSGTLLVDLGPLAADDVAALVGQLVGALPGPRLRALADQAGGNPLYVRELTEALLRSDGIQVRDGVAELVDGAGERVPVSLAAAIGHRLGFLPEAALVMLRVAAVLGVEFSLGDLSIVVGQSAAELVPTVTGAVTSGVLVEAGARLAFRHGLIRQVLYDGVPAVLRTGLHRQAARTLAEQGASVAAVAGQLLAAVRAESVAVADDWAAGWLADCGTALAYRTPELAAELLGRVAEVPDMDRVVRQRLNVAWFRALDLLRRNGVMVESGPAVLAEATVPEVVGEIAWLLGQALSRNGRRAEVLALVGPLLERSDLPLGWVARLRVLYAMQPTWIDPEAGHEVRSEALMRQAELEATGVGDRYAVVYALYGQALSCRTDRAGWQRRLGLIDRALAAAGDLVEAVNLRLWLLAGRAMALGALDRPVEGGRALRETLAAAEQQATPQFMARIRIVQTEWLLLQGRWDEAITELEVPEPWEATASTRFARIGQRALIALHRDEPAALAQRLSVVDDLDRNNTDEFLYGWHLLLAWALAAERDRQPALALSRLGDLLDRAVQPGQPVVDPDSCMWLPDGVRLATAAGESATARRWSELAEACVASSPSLVSRAVARHCVALVDADPAGALEAADLYDECERPFFAAQARENAAVLYAANADNSAARAAYARAVATYTQLNALWDLRRGDGRLRRYGIRRSPGANRRATQGWAALTPVELQVADLVATGRSNPEIARELYLSAHTIRAHVSHILAKLQARSRVDIAREAEHQRLTASTGSA